MAEAPDEVGIPPPNVKAEFEFVEALARDNAPPGGWSLKSEVEANGATDQSIPSVV